MITACYEAYLSMEKMLAAFAQLRGDDVEDSMGAGRGLPGDMELEASVNNGGLHQYFVNSSELSPINGLRRRPVANSDKCSTE